MKFNKEQLEVLKKYAFYIIEESRLQAVETPEYICIIGSIEVHYYPTKQYWYAPVTGAKGVGIRNACEYATLSLFDNNKVVCSN